MTSVEGPRWVLWQVIATGNATLEGWVNDTERQKSGPFIVVACSAWPRISMALKTLQYLCSQPHERLPTRQCIRAVTEKFQIAQHYMVPVHSTIVIFTKLQCSTVFKIKRRHQLTMRINLHHGSLVCSSPWRLVSCPSLASFVSLVQMHPPTKLYKRPTE